MWCRQAEEAQPEEEEVRPAVKLRRLCGDGRRGERRGRHAVRSSQPPQVRQPQSVSSLSQPFIRHVFRTGHVQLKLDCTETRTELIPSLGDKGLATGAAAISRLID